MDTTEYAAMRLERAREVVAAVYRLLDAPADGMDLGSALSLTADIKRLADTAGRLARRLEQWAEPPV